MFYAKKVDPELQISMLRVFIAKIFHWQLDYIDSLPMETLTELQAIMDGQARYEKDMSRKKR